jgi:farnesyl-diphosphate farnesyltransferase
MSMESVNTFVTSGMSEIATVLGEYPYYFLLFLCGIQVLFLLVSFIKSSKNKKTEAKIIHDAEQEMLMENDQCIVVDENDVVIGKDSKRQCHLRSNGLKLHRAFSIFIFDDEGRLLMQKRSKDKITFPLCWANTCCSHPLYVPEELEKESDPTHPNFGIGAKRAARRKCFQELGISPEQLPLECMEFMTRLHYRADLDEKWGEHEVDYLLVCRPPTKINVKINPNEVDKVKWFTKDELRNFCKEHKNDNVKEQSKSIVQLEPISPWFAAIEQSPHLLHKWWNAILKTTKRNESLDHVRDTTTIHRGGILFYYTPKKPISEPTCPTHKHSFMETLTRPSELIDALCFKASRAVNKRLKGPVLQFDSSTVQNKNLNVTLKTDLLFCEKILNKVSRSFAVVIAGLHPSLRVPVAIFYLILRALDTIEDETDLTRFVPGKRSKDVQRVFVRDDVVGFERQCELLRTFHLRLPTKESITKNPHLFTSNFNNNLNELIIDGIGSANPFEQDLLESFGCVLRVFAALPNEHQVVISDITKDMADGMVKFAGRDLANGSDNVEEYNKYCHYVAGLVGIGLTRQFVASGLEDGTDGRLNLNSSNANNAPFGAIYLSNSMGLFLQKTNIIRDYLEDLIEGRSFWPKDIWSIYSPEGLDKLKNDPDQALACLNHMVTDALQHGTDSLYYLDALKEPSIFAFAAIPQVMAIATLAEIYNEPKLFTGICKIRKSLAASIMLNVKDMKDIYKWFSIFATVILNKVKLKDPNGQRTIELCRKLGGGTYTTNGSSSNSYQRDGFFRSVLNVIGCWCGFKAPPNKSKKNI